MKPLIASLLGLFMLGWAAPASAQTGAPPVRDVVDQNGVDISRRTYMAAGTDLTVGPPDHRGLQQKRQWIGGWRQALVPKILGSGYNVTVTFNGTSAGFTYDAATSQYNSDSADGSTLNATRTVYTAADGTVINFVAQSYLFDRSYPWAIGTSVVYPDGTRWTYQYESFSGCYNCTYYSAATRLLSITSSAGYTLSYTYAQTPLHLYGYPQPRDDIRWLTLTRVDAGNLACASGCVSRYVTYGWADTSYDVPRALATVTDAAANVTNYTYGGDVTGIRLPGFTTNNITINYAPSSSTVTSVTRGPLTWTYSQTSTTGSVTDPAGVTRTVTFDGTYRVTSDEIRDSSANLIDSTSFEYCTTSDVNCPVGLLKKTTAREGNAVGFKYDPRGNTTETRLQAKPGTGLADIVTSAVYPSTCTNMKICNKPTSSTDARGGTTTYSWNVNNGELDSVTRPAVGGVSPQTRYSYAQVQAYNAYGQPVDQASWMLTQVSNCRTTSSCSNTADEARTTIAYASAGTPNNLLPVSVTKAAGDGSNSSTSSFSYDSVGNIVAVDGPLPGAVDISRMAYDTERRTIAVMGPDPDGASSRHPIAQRFTYAGDDQVVTAEIGNVPSQATDWSAFVAQQTAQSTYDSYGRKVKDVLSAGGTTQAVAQYSYDAAGHPLCNAVRMDPAQWNSQTDACVPQTSGSAGPDRVTRTTYDGGGRPTAVTTAYGTSAAATVSSTFTANGKLATVTDGENNTTAYAYDGFDRLLRTCFQTTTNAACAGSPSDYEQLAYDPNSNVTSRRLRDATTIGYTYDALDRLISKDLPNTAPYEYDTSYTYDLYDDLTQAIDTSAQVTNIGYDALGRETSEASNWTTRSWQYDAVGRRTRLTWGDGFYVTYDYDNASELTAIRENGGTALASFAYDDLGRRVSLTRSNGTATSYSYDAASRLSSLTNDLAGTAYDQTYGFSYNPANQVVSRTSSNDAYAFGGYANANRGYTRNGLNQYTNSGGTSLGYDARGNLTTSGSSTYGYTSENRLATAPGSYTMTYDPVGRFHWISNTGSPTWMEYDGDQIIEERTSAGVARKYVFVPGDDEPLVWYEGSGTSDRRFLYADERGSVVAEADSSGNKLAINSYDEFGIPQAGNVGRFQYTGQAWIAELGMYHYKARSYSPTLGRFMQTDPIGYADGVNWYSYAGNDPVNGRDPAGLADTPAAPAQMPSMSLDITVVGCRSGHWLYNVCLPEGDWVADMLEKAMRYSWLERGFAPPGGAPSAGGGAAAPQDPACNNKAAVAFIRAHQADAAKLAAMNGNTTAEILGLSLAEVGVGGNTLSKNGNNYFSMEGANSASFAYSTGVKYTSGGAPYATYSSYYDSGRSFLHRYGPKVHGITDPSTFANALVPSFNTGNPKTGGTLGFASNLASIIRSTEARMKCR